MRASSMAVPETTIYEHNRSKPRQNDIWFAWEVPSMDTIAVTLCVQPLANVQLRLCVFPANTGHNPAAGLPVKYVCHLARNTGTPDRPPLPTDHIVREYDKWPDNSAGVAPALRGTLLVFANGNCQARPSTPAKPSCRGRGSASLLTCRRSDGQPRI